MTEPVIDVGSNLEENLERWSLALKGGGDKLSVFQVIYSGKRKRWKAKEISEYLKGSISPKRVTEVGKRLVGDTLVRQVAALYPIVYEKRDDVHHYKGRILANALSKSKRAALATKRKVQVTVKPTTAAGAQHRASEVTIDDIDQFARARKMSKRQGPLKPLPEDRFKAGLQKLFGDSGVFKDWGGEKDDFYTNKLKIGGMRRTAAFALKGPGVGVKMMRPKHWGKHGDQIQRLLEAPARVFILQFEGQIDEYSIDQLKKLTELKASQEKRRLFYGYIDRDDSLRLRRAYPKCFQAGPTRRPHAKKRK